MASKLEILIESIPHNLQRYDTCGDYVEKGGLTSIHVSELPDRREMLLIAIHELIEWALCQSKGIPNEEIDRFDFAFEEKYRPHDENEPWGGYARLFNTAMEPGDDPSAPYYHAHQIATGIERILAAEMGVSWQDYETHIQELKK